MASYGTIGGAQAYVRRFTFDATGQPTTAQVLAWLEARSNELEGMIAAAGYATPVVEARGKAVLDDFANVGTAWSVELAQRINGSDGDENTRENEFKARWDEAAAWIGSGALGALGVPLASPAPRSSLSFVPAVFANSVARDEFGRCL